ncbi:hypothetical protein AVEN_99051-1 [Araneus ventricosus]|uniref:Uncharacterized protein n=1 Tax=Araneus ventricosus TaxID=182803 RepID=A0A4Y2FM80_ARAVE|nr:hypothetical protein AVEN_99051-1 [Araneus ventricosus]
MLLHFSTGGVKLYSEKRLRNLLSERYGNNVHISASMKCFGTVASFRPVASKILKDNWYADRKKEAVDEKRRIIDAAISILQEEVRSHVYDCSTCPTCEEISKGRENQEVLSVAHSIISSVCPRSFVSAVQVGIGVFLHRRFRSKLLINLLHNLGWSISCSEICKYETSITTNTSSEVQNNGFAQFVFDNADYNTRTVDGYGTFHVMGVVQCVTPASSVQTSSCIPRQKIIPTANIGGKFGFIPIVIHDWLKNHGLNLLVMEDVLSLKLRPMDVKIGTISLDLDGGSQVGCRASYGMEWFHGGCRKRKMLRRVSSGILALRQSSTF